MRRYRTQIVNYLIFSFMLIFSSSCSVKNIDNKISRNGDIFKLSLDSANMYIEAPDYIDIAELGYRTSNNPRFVIRNIILKHMRQFYIG